jgi:polyisoprenyl-teichoic acid--peptidoglycan teichoic acid transferase
VRADGTPRLAWAMWKRFLLGGALIVAFSATAVATAALLEVKDVAQIISSGQPPISGIDEVIDRAEAGRPQTILVLGSDRRYADIKAKIPARSDTLMLIRLDPDKDATTVMSIPRDLKVSIPGHGTDKINAAYSLGGPRLAVQTVKRLLDININHVVNVNFGGFRSVVDYIRCVYVDVDRRYFNDKSGGQNYAAIDIRAGYQRLCGQDALDYVRYRHEDNDFIRAARQQEFLRQAKQQAVERGLVSLGGVKKLARLLKSYTQTDVHSVDAILRLIKLSILSAGHPVQEVHFPADLAGPEDPFVTVSQPRLRRAVHDFLNAHASKGARGRVRATRDDRRAARKRKRRPIVTVGLARFRQTGEKLAAAAQAHTPFPVYYPTLSTPGAVPADLNLVPRTYDIYDEHRNRHRAYRMVFRKGIVGEYYGVQGMDWRDPPILDRSFDKRHMAGRDYRLYYDGSRLRLVAWKTPRAVYWVSNTLALTIRNPQMLALARSLRRLGA